MVRPARAAEVTYEEISNLLQLGPVEEGMLWDWCCDQKPLNAGEEDFRRQITDRLKGFVKTKDGWVPSSPPSPQSPKTVPPR